MLIQMIIDYKEKLQQKLTDSMVKERNLINQHFREIELNREGVKDILENVAEVQTELEEV